MRSLVRESEDRVADRLQAMEARVQASISRSSLQLEKALEEQVFYCSQSLINVVSLVEAKFKTHQELLKGSMASLERQIKGVNADWSSVDHKLDQRLLSHEASVRRQLDQLSRESDQRHQMISAAVTNLTVSVARLDLRCTGSPCQTQQPKAGSLLLDPRPMPLMRGTSAAVDDRSRSLSPDAPTAVTGESGA